MSYEYCYKNTHTHKKSQKDRKEKGSDTRLTTSIKENLNLKHSTCRQGEITPHDHDQNTREKIIRGK